MVIAVLMLTAADVAAQPLFAPDPRVRSLTYVADQVTTLNVQPGYALLVELSPDERIESLIVGNAAAWQVTATKRGDQFVVKSVGNGAQSDLIVTTTGRRYVFMLAEGDQSNATLVLRFDYPEPVTPVVTSAPILSQYRFSGDRSLFPEQMSGDGERVSIAWKPGTPMPAIFAVDTHGKDALVNGRMVDGRYVIEGVAQRYVFRRGDAQARAVRRPIRKAGR